MKSTIASDGLEIYYQTWGSPENPPVILLHGLGMDSRGYALQRFSLSKNYHTIAIDNRGSGSTQTDKAFNLYRLVRDVLKIMETENIESAHIVGTSMGGIVAQILGVVYPKKVNSLCLISTSCNQAPWRTKLLQSWRKQLYDRHSHVLDKEIVSWLIGPRLLKRGQIFLPVAQQLFKDIDIDGFCLQIDAITSFSDDFASRLSSIKCPTTIIVGSQDTLTPVGDSELLNMHIDHAELKIIYGAAHAVSLESPIETSRLIIEHLMNASEVSLSNELIENKS